MARVRKADVTRAAARLQWAEAEYGSNNRETERRRWEWRELQTAWDTQKAKTKRNPLRGKKKAEFLERMARGRKAASKRRNAKRGGSANAKSATSTRSRATRKRAGSRNPQLLTVNASRSRSRSRTRSRSTARPGRTTGSRPKSKSVSGTRSSKRSRNPQLLTVMNPTLQTTRDLAKARKAYRAFHGVDPKRVAKLGPRGPVLIALGELREIVYQPRRGHRRGPAFFHHFKAGNVLAVTADGKRLVIVDRRKRKAVDFDLGIVS